MADEQTKAAHQGSASVSFWIGLAVVLFAVGYIVTSAMGSTVHYYEVHEVDGQSEFVGTTMRLRGIVLAGSHRIREGTLDEHIFILSAGQSTITVLFAGAIPDQFQDGASVIATGVLRDLETFDADTITAQCPSRYEDEAPTASGNSDGQ